MPIINTEVLAGDSTFTLTNGSTTGRMLLVIATQFRNPANLGGFTYDGTAGTVYGQQTTSNGSDRTLCCLWTDSELPASAGSYALNRNTSTAGGTSYVVIELSGMDVAVTPESVSGAPASGSDPLTIQFSNSSAAFLGASLVLESASGTTLSAGAGQTTYFADTDEIATGDEVTAANGSLSIDSGQASGSFAYSGIALTELSSGPSLTAPASISPGETISFTATGFAPTAVTASDGTSTLTLSNIVNTSGDEYTAVVPALPAVGESLQYTTFGAVTLSATDGVDTAEDTTVLAAAEGQTVTTLGATFDTGELSWLYNFSPDPAPIEQGDQGVKSSPLLALSSDGGYVADEDGTYEITAIDKTDGIAQTYELIVGPAVASAGRFTRRNLTRRTFTRRSLTARP